VAQVTVLVIGEALVDVIVRPGQPARIHPGGSPLNVAVGLGRLGLPVALLSRFGTDSHGDLIAAHLGHNRVAVRPGSIGPQPTSVAEATIGADGAATYRFHVDWALSHHDIPGPAPSAVHTGSIAATLEPGAAAVTAALRRLRPTATITYDPNIRPGLTPDRRAAARRVNAMIATADVVKASDEDIAWLHPGAEPGNG
jgi:fructokinase